MFKRSKNPSGDQLLSKLQSLNPQIREENWSLLFKLARPKVLELIKKTGTSEEEALEILYEVLTKLKDLIESKDLRAVEELGLMQWIKYAAENELFYQGDPIASKAVRYLERKVKPWIAKLHYVNGEDEVNEVFQSAISDFLMSLDKIRRKEMSAYIIGICKNKGRDWGRKQTKEREHKQTILKNIGEEHKFEWPQPNNYFEISAEFKRQIQAIFSQIGSKCLSLLRLYYKEKKSGKEIAQISKYKDANVASHKVYLCRKKLKPLLEAQPILTEHLHLLWNQENL